MAIMDKVGTFGMLRYCLQLFPDSAAYFRPLIITLAVIGIVYGAVVAIGQTDVMRLIAYSFALAADLGARGRRLAARPERQLGSRRLLAVVVAGAQ